MRAKKSSGNLNHLVKFLFRDSVLNHEVWFRAFGRAVSRQSPMLVDVEIKKKTYCYDFCQRVPSSLQWGGRVLVAVRFHDWKSHQPWSGPSHAASGWAGDSESPEGAGSQQ